MRFINSKKPIQDIKPLTNKKPYKKYLFTALGLFITCIVIAQTLITIEFLNTHVFKWQSPIMVRTPLVIRRSTNVMISPLGKNKKVTGLLDVGAIADKIYTLESSGGKNDGCRDLGLFNGYGFRQNSSEWKCFSSHEEVRQLVINWLEGHIKQGDLAQALCLYNQGIDETKCTYAMNYQSL